MKSLIIRLNQRITIEQGGHVAIESLYFRDYLMKVEKIDEVYFCDKIVRNNADNYLNVFTTDFNDYDSIYIMNSPANFFGGVIGDDTIEKFKKISNYKGNIFYVLNDPKIYFVNTAERAFKTNKINENDYNNFIEKISKMRVIFTGQDYELYESLIKDKSNFFKLEFEKNIPLFEYMFINYNFNKIENTKKEKTFDLIYYGDNRGGYRDKLIKSYFDNDILNTKTVAFKNNFKNNSSIDKVRNEELSSEMQDCFGNLVIGDKEHNNNWITYRFFEGILANVINFIHIDYDKDKKYYKNELLKKLCYVRDSFDVEVSIDYIKKNNLYDEIVRLQHEELNKYNYLKNNQ